MEADAVETMTPVIARRVRQLRKTQDLSAQALADRCKELGMAGLNRRVLSNLETGRRKFVTVAELFTLAAALDTSPGFLLEPADPDEAVEVLPDVYAEPLAVREWVAGRQPLLRETRMREFIESAPKDERMRLRASGDPVVSLARRLTDIVTLAAQRASGDANERWTDDRIAEQLEIYLPAFAEYVVGLVEELRDEEERAERKRQQEAFRRGRVWEGDG